MNALQVGTPASIDGRQLRDRVVHPPADDQAHAVVDRAVARRHRAPFAEPGEQRSLGRRRRAGARVVEGQERRRPAEGGRDRILEEPIGLRRRSATRVWVWTSTTPGQDEEPGRVDHLVGRRRRVRPGRARWRRSGRPRRRRPPAASRSRSRPSRRGSSAGRRRCACGRLAEPSHLPDRCRMPRCAAPPEPAHRRAAPMLASPISRAVLPAARRATTVAKWFAASCPTFDAVVQPPYGKKISHSLMPPG